MSALNNSLLLGQEGGGGYAISRSLRFNSSDSAFCSRVPSSAGNRRTFTFACWMKRGKFGSVVSLIGVGTDSLNLDAFDLQDECLRYTRSTGGSFLTLKTTAVFRDPSAWYHVLLAVDTTQATAANRVRIYVNGVQQTAFSSSSYPSQNEDTFFNTTNTHTIGRRNNSQSDYFDGYLADCFLIDGQQVDPSSFGEFDTTTGVWMPKAYTGTYGTNGFHLDFSDNSTAAGLGTDNSGNGNNWTPNNLSVDTQGSNNYYNFLTASTGFQPAPFGKFNAFDSSTSTEATANGTGSVTFAPSFGISYTSSVEVWTAAACSYNFNSGAATGTTNAGSYTTVASGSGTFTSLVLTRAGGAMINAVRVDGTILTALPPQDNDSLVDVPTSTGTDTGVGGEVRGNYCTYNPIARSGLSNATLTNGNLDISGTGSSYTGNLSTIAVNSGKWYYEFTVTNAPNSSTGAGIVSTDTIGSANASNAGFGDCSGGYLRIGTVVYNNGSAISTGLSSIGTGDVVNVAFDLDAGKIWFGKNGTWDSSGNPATGSNAVATFTPAGRYFYIFAQGFYGSGTWSGVLNAGARSFAYTAPSGFKALNTASLPSPLVTKPSTVMDVALWTGNGSTQSITTDFSPDFVWIKSRSASGSHNLFDAVRGATNLLETQNTDPETTNATTTLTSFNSNGFSLSSSTRVNGNGTTYAGWTWDAGSSTVTNTQGSITSSVRTNNYLSVVTYTGTGANATIGHGLGAAPSFIIVKNRSSATNWRVYHGELGNTKAIFLSTTGNPDTSSVYWNNTSPTSTVFSVGSDDGVNGNGNSMVAYLFSPVAGYSSFGSYTGNGSTDGAFVYTGFRPAFIIVKNSTVGGAGYSWYMWDSKRPGYNWQGGEVFSDQSSAEDTGFERLDILSNGFKLRSAGAAINGSSSTIIYAAFAESPFQYARAR